ncbi:hypothetical protein ACWT_6157 [Actinoplanes sp. SE50]|nr:hypothetical protein ACPL_6289 [Actinoplanes sp. SE50/110]ATO85572.1 hypothetical protein ACWT_6157 [Actinoplanes sp. SE50]SLM02985.1 hypothetical protein ACSP50_6270 [Actinoplanes sp. SE50/110]
MDALASIFSTAEFRKCMSEWRWAFEQAAIAHKEYQTFCAAPQVGPDNPKHEEQFIKLRDDRQYRIDAFGEAHKRLCELAAKDVQGVNSSLTLK